MPHKQTSETTLGDLIVALTDQAAPLARNERELYRLVSGMLSNLLVVRHGTRDMSREAA